MEGCLGAQVRAQSGHAHMILEPDVTAQEAGEMGAKWGHEKQAGAHRHEQSPHKDRHLHQFCL